MLCCARSSLHGACLGNRTHSCPSTSAWSILLGLAQYRARRCSHQCCTSHSYHAFHLRPFCLLSWGSFTFFSFCLMSEDIEALVSRVAFLLRVTTGAKNPNIWTLLFPTILLSCLLRQFTKNQIPLQGFSHPDLSMAYKEQFLLLFQSLSLVSMKVILWRLFWMIKGSPPPKPPFLRKINSGNHLAN